MQTSWPHIVSRSRGRVGVAQRYVRDTMRLDSETEIAGTVARLFAEMDLLQKMVVAEKLANCSDKAVVMTELADQAAERAQRGAVGGLRAVECLHERLAANVNLKTAYAALAVELL